MFDNSRRGGIMNRRLKQLQIEKQKFNDLLIHSTNEREKQIYTSKIKILEKEENEIREKMKGVK